MPLPIWLQGDRMKKLLALNASAGSGKTYQLALRYLSLLFLEKEIQNIVAVTFTNKAAFEMKERVSAFLLQMDDEIEKKLLEHTGLSKEEFDKRLPLIKKRFLSGDLMIVTIDSFVQSILRKFAYYVGLAQDFEIGKSDYYEEFVTGLDKSTFEELIAFAKWYGKGDLSGFFEALYEKDKELPRLQTNFYEEVDQSIAKLYRQIANYIQQNGTPAKQKEFDPQRDIEDALMSKSGFRAWVKKSSFSEVRGIKNPEPIDPLLHRLQDAIAKRFANKEARFLQMLYHLYGTYKQTIDKKIAKTNRLSFADIKHKTYDLLYQESIPQDFFYFRLDSAVTHLLIDEFQDTSVEDWKIFEPLADEIAAGVGRRDFRSFFFVGDPKQAIYGFRGGNAALFEYVIRKYGMQSQELEVNYRSRQVIVEFVNDTFAHLLHKKQKSVRPKGYVEVEETSELEEALIKRVEKMLDAGIKESDIAILVPTNKDVAKVEELLLQRLQKKAVTSATKEVIHQPRAKALIDLLRYFYEEEKIELYRFNFEQVTMQEAPKELDLSTSPSCLIKRLIEQYSLWDEGTLKLLEKSIEYKDFVEFFAAIDEFDAKITAAGEGIEVVTIHKSKGLAYKNVIAMDSFFSERKRGSKLLFDQNGVVIDGVYLRIKDREFFDPVYKKALEREEKRLEAEREHVAYVALTRAKDMLFVIKKEQNSRFWMVKPTKRGEFGRYEEEPKSDRTSSLRISLPKLRYYGKQEIVQESEYKPNDYEAIYLGKAYHSAFEVGIEYARLQYERYGYDFDKIAADVEQANSNILQNFKGVYYREIPFQFSKKMGIIDLLIELNDGYVIIDYKSASVHDQSAYRKQVGFYKDAVRAITKKPVEGYLYYIDKNELVKV